MRQAPKGVKAVANWLNGKGYRTRQGGMWSIGTLHQLLTNPVYGGRWRFNHVDSRTRRRKADAEQIFSDAPSDYRARAFRQRPGARERVAILG